MSVKYPEFNELKKESAFDWLVKSEGESFTKNKAIIRFDMFTQNRKVSISNDMKKAIKEEWKSIIKSSGAILRGSLWSFKKYIYSIYNIWYYIYVKKRLIDFYIKKYTNLIIKII